MAYAPDNSSHELRPLSVGELSRVVADRHATGGPPLQIVGGRTSLQWHASPPSESETLSTVGLAKILDYPARDMTITVEAGIRIDELQCRLRDEGQTLPIDIPEAHRTTVGGAIASNTCGPCRYGYGTFRDFLLGITAVDGRGRMFHAGGRVVKNVAGYDLCKLMVGSRGRLAVIAEVTLKVVPRPACRELVWLQIRDWSDVEESLELLTKTATRPVAVEVLDRRAAAQVSQEGKLTLPDGGPVLCVAFDGTERECRWQTETIERELAGVSTIEREVVGPEDADELWTALTEYQTASDEPVTFEAVVRPSRLIELIRQLTSSGVAVQTHAANGVLIGHLPDTCTDAESAAAIVDDVRKFSAVNGGGIVRLRCEPGWREVLQSRDEGGAIQIERRLKEAFDPVGVLNPHLEAAAAMG